MSSRSVRPRPKAIRLPGIAGSLSILLLCACCRCVQAQDVADSPDAIELPAIRVEDSRTPDAANEAGASRLRGEALRDRKGATLGETVGDEAGVHNASFGTGVGLPVIRGLTGDRILILQDGERTGDHGADGHDNGQTLTTIQFHLSLLRGEAHGGGPADGRPAWHGVRTNVGHAFDASPS